jgi:3-phenylpropionate/cinnamic acid dioxygenase small subunit
MKHTPNVPRAAAQIVSDMPVDERDYASVRDFLFHEAELLDERRYSEWQALLTSDIRYRVTAHIAQPPNEDPKEVLILNDRAAEIEIRIKQISSPNLTYAENPASLMRRFVSNIRVRSAVVTGEFSVNSYVLVYRNGGTIAEPFTYSIARSDIVRRVKGALHLASRTARLDQTVIGIPNLATFV